MASTGNITLPENLLPQLEEIARAENRTADDLGAEAVKTLIARKAIDRFERRAVAFRGEMTDEQVQELVDGAIHEYRGGPRDR